MSSDILQPKIDMVLTTWQKGFAQLQDARSQGRAVGEADVRRVVLATAEQMYQEGVTPEQLQSAGHRPSECAPITATLSTFKIPANEVLGSGGDGLKVGVYQAAALKDALRNGSVDMVLRGIRQNPDFSPIRVSSAVAQEAPQPVINAPTGVSVQQSADSAKNLLQKLAPPEELTTPSSELPQPALYGGSVAPAISLEKPLFVETKPMTITASTSTTNPSPATVGGSGDILLTGLTQMPVKVIEPLGTANDVPKDALGRIIH